MTTPSLTDRQKFALLSLRLEEGRALELEHKDPALRHLDHAWASTVHAFQGRTVDNVIAAMEASHPHLTTQKSFYVEISRARDLAELVTDDAGTLREHLETATGERISALEGVGAGKPEPGNVPDRGTREAARTPDPGEGIESAPGSDTGVEAPQSGDRPDRPGERQVELEVEL